MTGKGEVHSIMGMKAGGWLTEVGRGFPEISLLGPSLQLTLALDATPTPASQGGPALPQWCTDPWSILIQQGAQQLELPPSVLSHQALKLPWPSVVPLLPSTFLLLTGLSQSYYCKVQREPSVTHLKSLS